MACVRDRLLAISDTGSQSCNRAPDSDRTSTCRSSGDRADQLRHRGNLGGGWLPRLHHHIYLVVKEQSLESYSSIGESAEIRTPLDLLKRQGFTSKVSDPSSCRRGDLNSFRPD